MTAAMMINQPRSPRLPGSCCNVPTGAKMFDVREDGAHGLCTEDNLFKVTQQWRSSSLTLLAHVILFYLIQCWLYPKKSISTVKHRIVEKKVVISLTIKYLLKRHFLRHLQYTELHISAVGVSAVCRAPHYLYIGGFSPAAKLAHKPWNRRSLTPPRRRVCHCYVTWNTEFFSGYRTT